MPTFLDSPPIQFRLTKDLYADLQALAIEYDASLDQISRYAIRLFIHDQKKKKEAPENNGG